MNDIQKAITGIVIVLIVGIAISVHYAISAQQTNKALENELTANVNARQDFQILMNATGGNCSASGCGNPTVVSCTSFKDSANVQNCQLTEQAMGSTN